MTERSRSSSSTVVAAVLLLLLPPVVYAGGYFLLSDPVDVQSILERQQPTYWRSFPSRWLMVAYRPMARIECMVTGADITLHCPHFQFEHVESGNLEGSGLFLD